MIIFFNSAKSFGYRSFIRFYGQHVRKPLFDEKPTLFGDEASPPVRFVMMTASALNVEYKLHRVDLFCSEHKSEFYTRINPLQKVPALAVGEHIISDSHAIALYLCRRSRDNKLYSKSTKIKSQIDQMLFFNSGTLFPIDSAIFSEYFTGKWPADENKVKDWYRALDYLEHRLKEHNWLAGDRVSICDLCCVTTVSSLQLLLPLSDRHSNISDWLQRLQKLPFYKLNERGLKRLNVFVEKIKSIL